MQLAIDHIPEVIRAAFGDRAEISLQALARAMGRDIKTLRRLRMSQQLPVHIKGTGLARRHYVCTLSDVAEFYRRTGEACQYFASEARPITSSTSKSNIIDFTGRPKSEMNVKLRTSRKRSAPKLSD